MLQRNTKNNIQVLKSVIIYTTDWCSYCDLAKRFFYEKGWDFEEINIEQLKKIIGLKFNRDMGKWKVLLIVNKV